MRKRWIDYTGCEIILKKLWENYGMRLKAVENIAPFCDWTAAGSTRSHDSLKASWTSQMETLPSATFEGLTL